jgi:dermatan/chondrotin sulfate uronyl 2-O-sulfotransferase UST
MTRLVYNRISKAGSSAMMSLLLKLSRLNNFTLFREVDTYPNSTTLMDHLITMPENSVYINHCNYIEGLPSDYVWINMAREPVEREVSYYYYTVDPNLRGKKAEASVEEQIADPCGCAYMEFDTCIKFRYESTKPNCTHALDYISLSQMGFFRSISPKAEIEENRESEKEIFSRVKNKYLFVGLTDEFELSLKMFEKLLPQFFAGAVKVHADDPHSRATSDENPLTKTNLTGAISTRARKILESHNAEESLLYEKIKRLFWLRVAEHHPQLLSLD